MESWSPLAKSESVTYIVEVEGTRVIPPFEYVLTVPAETVRAVARGMATYTGRNVTVREPNGRLWPDLSALWPWAD